MLSVFSACQQLDPLVPLADEQKSDGKDKVALPATWSSVSSQTTVVNGRIRFVDDVHFNDYFRVVSTVDEKVVEDFFAGLPNFNSLKERNQREELADTTSHEDVNCRTLRDGSIWCTNLNPPRATDEGAEGAESLIQDEFLYFATNENYELAIGTTIVKITPQYTYLIINGQTVTFDPTLNNLTQQQHKKATSENFFMVREGLYAHKNETFVQENIYDKTSFNCGQSEQNEYDYTSGRGRRKIKAKIWSQNLGIYSSAGCSTKNLRRRLGIFWQERTDKISVFWPTFEYEIKDPNTGQYVNFLHYTGAHFDNNKSKQIERFEFKTAIVKVKCVPNGPCVPADIKFSGCIKLICVKTNHTVHNGSNSGQLNLTLACP
ncbi:MAG: hypothetical protein MUE85_04370 [Microscillaceae bacterium]|nr:hypothetical protein [Microscillaceae bacterium]